MSEPRFKPGDLVHLKSGGHYMTVGATVDAQITCNWHDPNGVPHRADYNEAQLLLALPMEHAVEHAVEQPMKEDWRNKHGL